MAGMGESPKKSLDNLIEALERACERGSLLCYKPENSSLLDGTFFINSPKGRAAFKAVKQGSWAPQESGSGSIDPDT